jgi:hypothetical protein
MACPASGNHRIEATKEEMKAHGEKEKGSQEKTGSQKESGR